MKHTLFLFLTVTPLFKSCADFLSSWRVQDISHRTDYRKLITMWAQQVKESDDSLKHALISIRELYIEANSDAVKQKLYHDLYLFLEPHFKLSGARLCEKRGWPDFSQRPIAHWDFPDDIKLEVLDELRDRCTTKLTKQDWKSLRGIRTDHKFSFKFYLNTVVVSSRVDLFRKIYGTVNRKNFEAAKLFGKCGVLLFKLVFGKFMSLERAYNELVCVHNLQISYDEILSMMEKIGPVNPAYCPTQQIKIVGGFDPDNDEVVEDFVDPAKSVEKILVSFDPIPESLIGKVQLTGREKYVLKHYLAGDSQRSCADVSEILGKGFGQETVRVIINGIIEKMRTLSEKDKQALIEHRKKSATFYIMPDASISGVNDHSSDEVCR